MRVAVTLPARRDEALGIGLGQPLDLAQPEAQCHPRAIAVARLQRAVPAAEIDVDRANFDAVLLGVADDLRRRVEPHRLRIQQRTGKNIGVAALDPG